eukprot:COSAG02_NODE_731_length_17977_cov_21.672838_7_plen_54_part_00
MDTNLVCSSTYRVHLQSKAMYRSLTFHDSISAIHRAYTRQYHTSSSEYNSTSS